MRISAIESSLAQRKTVHYQTKPAFVGSNDTDDEEKENLIVPDVTTYNHAYSRNMSKSLAETFNKIRIMKDEAPLNKEIVIAKSQDDFKTSVIYTRRSGFKFRDITTGFAYGKAGNFGIVDTKDFADILLEGASIESEKFNFSNKVCTKDEYFDILRNLGQNMLKYQPSFCGANINCFYRASKTHEAVNTFFEHNIESYLQDEQEIHKKNKKEFGDDFDGYVLAGGFGSRLQVLIDANNDNKPSAPTVVRNWPLMNFTMYNLWKAGLIDNKNDVTLIDQTEPNSAVGCFVTTAGYKIDDKYDIKLQKTNPNQENIMTKNADGIALTTNPEASVLDKKKNIVVLPADNVTDIELADVLRDFKSRKDAGIMVVSVPDKRAYGGLILADEDNKIFSFVSKEDERYKVKGNKEAYLGKFLDEKTTDEIVDNYNKLNKTTGALKGMSKEQIVEKYGCLGKDEDGNKLYAGNGFIYIIHPDLVDTIAKIYSDKVDEAYYKIFNQIKINDKFASSKSISKPLKNDIIEALWDREIIPTLVDMANNNKLRDRSGKILNVYTHKAKNCNWNDVGQLNKDSFIRTMKEIASPDKYKFFPESIKSEARENIEQSNDGGTIVYLNPNQTDIKDAFKNMFKTRGGIKSGHIGDFKTYGDHIVVGKKEVFDSRQNKVSA